jgi:hypothetical protein
MRRRAPAGLILEIDVGEQVAVGVAGDTAVLAELFVGIVDRPRRRERRSANSGGRFRSRLGGPAGLALRRDRLSGGARTRQCLGTGETPSASTPKHGKIPRCATYRNDFSAKF